MSAADDARALELRRAGLSVARIREELKAEDGSQVFRSSKAVEVGIQRALATSGVLRDPESIRLLELDRLDRIQQAVWVRAAKGDLNAVDRVIKLTEVRTRLSGVASSEATAMQDSLEKTLAALSLEPADESIVESGRQIARRIDAALASGDELAATKAMYLVPHLVNVLRELGATPEARRALKEAVPSAKQGKLTALRGGAAPAV